MSVVSFQGGPITHRYLMRKVKADLAFLVTDYEHLLQHKIILTHRHMMGMTKDSLCRYILELVKRLPEDDK